MTIFSKLSRKDEEIEKELIGLILDQFSRETELPIGLFDKDNNYFPAVSRNCFSGFCAKLQKYSCALRKCDDDHRKRASYSKEMVIDYCHAGLINVSYPILLGKKHVATLLYGQRRKVDNGEGKFLFDKFLRKDCFDEAEKEQLTREWEEVPEVDEKMFGEINYDYLVSVSEKIMALRKHRMQREEEAELVKNNINSLVHEILIPMQAVCSNAENLYMQIDSGRYNLTKKEQTVAAKMIVSQMNILGMHAENIQKALIKNKKTPYSFIVSDIGIIIGQCIDLFNVVANEKGVFLSEPVLRGMVKYPKTKIALPFLSRAIKNIYHNALKYSFDGKKEGRWISTLIQMDGLDSYIVKISNYGTGIREDEWEKVFDEGYRSDLSFDRNRTGSGLGLSESKRIIEKHGGKIWLKSKMMGGPYLTNVYVKLPIHK
ncbi:MAG: PocR ligand-binding domain-containing protein [Candidatus Omnitrophica bacterium]|nr:PocR ligand-binding domain-containing protein [Candidatus Omnitrophota bacterium]